MEYFLQNILLPREATVYFFGFVFSLALIITAGIVLHFAEKNNNLSIKLIVRTEDYVVSILLSLWIFNLFYLHFAFLLWIVTYFVLTVLTKKNRVVHRLIKTYEKHPLMLSRKQIKEYQKISSSLDFSKTKCLKKFMQIRSQKKIIADEIVNNNLQNTLPKRFTFFPFLIYAVGILFPAINDVLFGGQYYNTGSVWLVLLENYIALFAILFISYPVAHYLTVDNEGHSLYGCEITFKILFSVFSVILFAIFTGFSIN